MARKIFFISVALIPIVCMLTFIIPAPAPANAVEQMQFDQNMGQIAFYIIILLIIVAVGAAVYDRFHPSDKKVKDES